METKSALRAFTDLFQENRRLQKITKAKILNNMGCALWGLGYREQAAERFEKALKTVPDFFYASSNLSELKSQGVQAAQ